MLTHKNASTATTRAGTGCRKTSRSTRTISRTSQAIKMSPAGVRYTGARNTGRANGSGL